MSENTPLNESVAPKDLSDKAVGYWEKNSKKILLAGAAIVVAIGGYFGYSTLVQQPAEEKAAEALFKAEEYFRMDSTAKALNGDATSPGLLKVIKDHSGTKAANLAQYYAGAAYLKQGDFKNAEKHLKAFTTSSTLLKAKSLGLLGDALSEQGNKEEAVAYYKKAGVAMPDDEYFSSEYLFRAGYLLETMGKKKEAVEQYKIIKEKYPTSQRGYDIEKFLARLNEFK